MTGGQEAQTKELQLSPRDTGMRANSLIDTIVANAENTPGAITVSASVDNQHGVRHLYLTGERNGKKFEIRYKDNGASQKGMGSLLTRDKSLHVWIEGDETWGYVDTRLLVGVSSGKEIITGAEKGTISTGNTEGAQTNPLGGPKPPVTEDDYERARKNFAPLLD